MASGKDKKSKNKQPSNKSGVWCVELGLNNNMCRVCIFNGHEEARLFLYSALDGVLENLNVTDANMWEM